MLERLVVSNFAIIENIDIKLKDGLTVLTGETGAGKSLIIDSLSLLLGDRANVELIRTGETKAEITGYFKVSNVHLTALLDSLGISILDNNVIIERTISQSKSTIKINDKLVTLNDLKKVSKYLADIHMQFDMQKILNPENYLEIIDGFKYDLCLEYKNKYLEALEDFKNKRKELIALEDKIKAVNEKKDIYEYHLKELENLAIEPNEDEKILDKISYLKNYDKIYSILEESISVIDSDFLDNLYTIKNNLEKLSEYQGEYKEKHDTVNDYYYELDSIFSDIKKGFRHLDYDPSELTNLETRLNDIENAKKKYSKSIDELISYKDELKVLLSMNENFDDTLKELENSLKVKYDDTYSKALELSKIRGEIAISIEKELEKNMADLSLKAVFKVDQKVSEKEADLTGDIFTLNGIDNVDFLIETNIGEGLKSLSKTISGGEASRIMLAIKALFIKSQKISTVVFDEIDTGISGEVAMKVAEKIYEISLSTQVISITHLPQVASKSKNHLKVSKRVENGRTYTSVKELTLDEKIHEVALMISSGNITEKQLEYAKEMVMMK